MNIVFSHCTMSYPLRFCASNTKAEYLSLGLMKAGANVVFINGIEGSDVNADAVLKHKGIKCYLFAKKGNKLVQILANIGKLVKILVREYKGSDDNVLFVGGRTPIFLYQLFCARIIGYKCVWMTQEWEPSILGNTLYGKVSSYIATKWYAKWLHGIFPISHFLWNKYVRFNKPMRIIPVLADFNAGSNYKQDTQFNHFAYCAGVAYYDVIEMVIEAFAKYINDGGLHKLILVLYGKKELVENVIKKIVMVGMTEWIQVKQQVSDEELMSIYRSSLGLLIPLNPNSVADEARFSQKIAEYLSTMRPIITCNVGEIRYYFTDRENCILTDYSAVSICEGLKFLASDEERANRIGENGFCLGKKYFDYLDNGQKVMDYIISKIV